MQISKKTSLATCDFRKSGVHVPLAATSSRGLFSATMVGGIYTQVAKNFKKYSRELNLLGVRRNMEGSILEVNFEGLGW